MLGFKRREEGILTARACLDQSIIFLNLDELQ